MRNKKKISKREIKRRADQSHQQWEKDNPDIVHRMNMMWRQTEKMIDCMKPYLGMYR